MSDIVTSGLPPLAARELEEALAAMRQTGIVVRAADLLGRILGRGGDVMLRGMGMGGGPATLAPLAEIALERAYDVAILGMNTEAGQRAARRSRAVVITSGLLGGMAGLAGFFPDAALTTLVVLREVARIAAESGEDLQSEDSRAACVQVLALRQADESGYFGARLMLHGGPARALLAQIASRWGAVLGEKFAAGAVPLAGAAAAATLNAAFLEHYRRLARAHFTIRRLERAHGREIVRQAAGLRENLEDDAPFLAA